MADFDRESLSKLRVAELQQQLSARNLPTSGLKEELITRLREALEREQSNDDGDLENVPEVTEQDKEAETENQPAGQAKETAMEDKFLQLLSFMTEMRRGQEEMKNEMSKKQEEMQSNIVNLINTRVDAIEEKVEILEKKSEGRFEIIDGKFEGIEGKFEEIEGKFNERIEKIKQEMKVQTEKESTKTYEIPKEFEVPDESKSRNSQHMPTVNQPCMKLLPYDGQTSWQVYKTQFAIVAEANGWDPITKARQLAASLRAGAADILRTIPEKQQLNFDALSSALELRFGEKCLKDYSRLQLKTRQ